jgi:FKBP-type peptidyl-prolyl cis-trans isomerase SlpA
MSAKTPQIRPGSRVRLHLRISLADGTEVLSSFGAEPLEAAFGDGTLAPALENLLMGLRAGADTRFFVDGAEIYGSRDEANVYWLPRSNFPPHFDLACGQVVAFDAPDGQEMAGVLMQVDENRVQVDFNHPLAGRSLQIRAQILAVRDPGNGDSSAPSTLR